MGLRGIGGEILSLGKQTVAVMAGRYLGRTITAMIPYTPAAGASPTMVATVDLAKSALVAILLKKFGRRVLSADLVDALAVGVMLNPLSSVITAVSPSAGAFLSGGMAFPTFPGTPIGNYARMGSYGGTDSDDSTYVGSYSENNVYQQ